MERCGWCLCNEKMVKYHDEEWGVPVHDDRKQFEYLMMEAIHSPSRRTADGRKPSPTPDT